MKKLEIITKFDFVPPGYPLGMYGVVGCINFTLSVFLISYIERFSLYMFFPSVLYIPAMIPGILLCPLYPQTPLILGVSTRLVLSSSSVFSSSLNLRLLCFDSSSYFLYWAIFFHYVLGFSLRHKTHDFIASNPPLYILNLGDFVIFLKLSGFQLFVMLDPSILDLTSYLLNFVPHSS